MGRGRGAERRGEGVRGRKVSAFDPFVHPAVVPPLLDDAVIVVAVRVLLVFTSDTEVGLAAAELFISGGRQPTDCNTMGVAMGGGWSTRCAGICQVRGVAGMLQSATGRRGHRGSCR